MAHRVVGDWHIKVSVQIKKGKGAYSSSWNSPQNYGTSLVNRITPYYLPPDRGDRPAFTPKGGGYQFIDPVRMKGWVGLVGWLHTEMVYPSTDDHPSEYYNRVWRSATTLIEANALPLSQTANQDSMIDVLLRLLQQLITVVSTSVDIHDNSRCL